MAKEKAAKVFSDELIDEWLKEGRKPEDVNGLLKQITKAVVERAMQGEMTRHLGYTKHDPAGNKSGNSRNTAHFAPVNAASLLTARRESFEVRKVWLPERKSDKEPVG